MRRLSLFLAAVMATGCAGDSTAPDAITVQGAPSALMDGGSAEPNVVRFGSEYFFGITDTETDLLAFAGLPADPKNWYGCFGGEPLQTVSFQYTGLQQDAIKGLMSSGNVNLVVYRNSTYQGICWSTPIATGTGRVTYVDNNVFGTPTTHGDEYGWHMEGTVTLANGTSAHLIAHNRWQALPNGTFRRIFRQVRLTTE
jgi:hypothetical protein